MGRAQVRSAVTSAIEGAVEAGTIPYVGTVYDARAYVSEQDYEVNAVGFYTSSINGSGCVLVVNLPGPDKRTRYADGGRGTVADFDKHPVAIELFFASKGGGLVTGDQLVNAQHDYDAVADALVTFIRGNPTFQAPSTVWSAGEFKAGVEHRQSEPFTDSEGMTTFIVGDVRFDAWEQLVGAAGTV